MKKKIIALALTVMMLITLCPVFAGAQEFNDTGEHWAKSAVERWSGYGVLNGYEDGSFKPDGNVTRAEAAKVINTVIGYQKTAANNFADLTGGEWYADHVLKLAAAGIISGYTDGTVRGNAYVTRQEAAVMLSRVFAIRGAAGSVNAFVDANEIGSWAAEAVGGMVEKGYIEGYPDGTFNPGGYLTRGALVTILDKIVAGFYNAAGTFSADVTGLVVVNTPDVVFEDMTVNGNLFVTPGVGNGDFTLDNVDVKGNARFEGGGVNSIIIKGGTKIEGTVTVYKVDGNLRIVVENGSDVEFVFVDDGSDDVIITGEIGSLEIGENVTVVATDATIGTVNMNHDGATLIIGADTTVGTVVVNANNATIEGDGEVTDIKVESGDGIVIEVEDANVTVSDNAGEVTVGGEVVNPGDTTGETGDTGDTGSTGDTGGTNNPPPLPPTQPTAAQNFASELNAIQAGCATASGTTVTLAADLTLEADLTIPTGLTLVVPATKTLTNDDGITLIVDGTLTINGALTIDDSELIINGTVTLNGSFSFTTGSIDNNGIIDGSNIVKYNAHESSGYGLDNEEADYFFDGGIVVFYNLSELAPATQFNFTDAKAGLDFFYYKDGNAWKLGMLVNQHAAHIDIGLNMNGAGTGLYKNMVTKIVLKGDSTTHKITNASPIFITQNHMVTGRSLIIDGCYTTGAKCELDFGIHLVNVKNVTIANIKYNIAIDGAVKITTPEDAVGSGNAKYQATVFVGGGCQNVAIENCEIDIAAGYIFAVATPMNAGVYGVFVSGAVTGNVRVSGCTITNAYTIVSATAAYGIWVSAPAYITLYDNTVSCVNDTAIGFGLDGVTGATGLTGISDTNTLTADCEILVVATKAMILANGIIETGITLADVTLDSDYFTNVITTLLPAFNNNNLSVVLYLTDATSTAKSISFNYAADTWSCTQWCDITT